MNWRLTTSACDPSLQPSRLSWRCSLGSISSANFNAQLIRRLRLTNNLRHCVSRFSPAAQSLAEADIIWSCTCPKTGVVTPVENPCSITSYIGLDQLLRSSICQKKMPHEILYYRSSTSEFRINAPDTCQAETISAGSDTVRPTSSRNSAV